MDLSLSTDACYAALASRDLRFDGQFFVGVSSTGIYCRPICRVRLPVKKNCTFYASAVQAEREGFRPCLRCRPELASRWSTVDIGESLAKHALQMFDTLFAEENVTERVSVQLGVSERHVRRLLQQHAGVSPLQYVQTRRLLFAKQLLTDTDLPISEIALIAGFGSIRRFNSSLKSAYNLTPSGLRKSRAKSFATSPDKNRTQDQDVITCQLSVIEPFDFPSLLTFHSRRAVLAMESVDETSYTRAIELTDSQTQKTAIGWYRLRQVNRTKLCLEVSKTLSQDLAKVIQCVKAQFDLDANPHHWLPVLGELAGENPGLRVPGGPAGFEIAVRAILGQQVSVEAATTLTHRLVNQFGSKGIAGGPARTFPTANALARCRGTTLNKLGIINTRAAAIQGVARLVADGSLSLNPGAHLQETKATLMELPGIGPWTVNYILMRALRWPDAFIDTDLGIVKAAKQRGVDDILAESERWRPWRAYAAMHLWQSLNTTEAL